MIGDEDLLRSFEEGTLLAESFHHHEHVRLAWLYLQRYDVLEALKRFSSGLKMFAAVHGQANLYHETITWAFVFLINERIERGAGEKEWRKFVAGNRDLLNWQANILTEYYGEQTLCSEVARKIFVMPDKGTKERRMQ